MCEGLGEREGEGGEGFGIGWDRGFRVRFPVPVRGLDHHYCDFALLLIAFRPYPYFP
jgi:hypothetical protein